MMITQFDAYLVKKQTGLDAYTNESRAREIVERSYPGNQKVELVTVTTTAGQIVSAWVIKSRKAQS